MTNLTSKPASIKLSLAKDVRNTLIVALLSYLIRAITIGWHGLNDVEAQTAGIASLTDWYHFIAVCKADGNPPGFHCLIKLWTAVFGWSDIALKSLALLISGALPPIVFITIKKRLNEKFAWQTALLAIFSPTLVCVSNMLRPHGLIAILAWLSTDQLFSLLSQPNSWRQRLKYTALITTMMYCHMLAAGLPIAHAFYVLLALGKKWISPTQAKSWLPTPFLSLLLFSPLLSSIGAVTFQTVQLWHVEAGLIPFIIYLCYVTASKCGVLLPISQWKCAYSLLFCGVAALPPTIKIKQQSESAYSWLRQFYCIGLGSYVAMGVIFMQIIHTVRDRYVSYLIIFALLLFTTSIHRYFYKLPTIISFILPLLLTIPLWLPSLQTISLLSNSAAYKAVQPILKKTNPSKDLIVCTWEALSPEFSRLLPSNYHLIAFPDTERVLYVDFNDLQLRIRDESCYYKFESIVKETLDKGGTVWLIANEPYFRPNVGDRTEVKEQDNFCAAEEISSTRLKKWLTDHAQVNGKTEYFLSNYARLSETAYVPSK